ncbi:MAG: S-methyl-5'-thioadenosine phosphorylase, partial [Methanobacteriaceae archaeon]|nr:S-methyl-5'-thioadenosine phosphorylase [Methanobacteriaceae archaeon]
MIGIIGGTGIYQIVERGEELSCSVVETPFGSSPEISLFQLHHQEFIFMPRHAMGHANPPHMVNYRANIWALKKMGVDRIIATNAVGSLDESIKPGDFVVPHDFLDFTRMRNGTFYDKKTVHIDVTEPYCPQLRDILILSGTVRGEGIYVCTEGPRFETAAEVEMFRRLGGTVVGMTGLPEAVLARELEMCYATVCTVSNFAASISPNKLTTDEVLEVVNEKREDLIGLLTDVLFEIPSKCQCPCQNTLNGAEIDIS